MARKSALSHVDAHGRVKMVDVSDKAVTAREAVARGSISMSRAALTQIRRGKVKKGDPLQAARLAGIMAAKQTSFLIPLCHPLPISSVERRPDSDRPRLRHRSAGAHDGADRRRDGSAHGRCGRGAHHLRHGEGGGQGDGDWRRAAGAQNRRKIRRVPEGQVEIAQLQDCRIAGWLRTQDSGAGLFTSRIALDDGLGFELRGNLSRRGNGSNRQGISWLPTERLSLDGSPCIPLPPPLPRSLRPS